MKAVVLSAGYGTRMGALTESIPKPMLDVAGRPLLEHLLRHLARHGFDEISLNLHFMPEAITGHFGDGALTGQKLSYSHEGNLLGTAGGVRKMLPAPTETVLVHYGDVVTDQDFSAMLAFHRSQGALATMLIHQRRGSNSVVVLDDQQRVTQFLERPSEEQRRGIDSPWVNSGVCFYEPEVIEMIPTGQTCDLARDILPQLVGTGRLFGFPLTGFRCAVDSPQRLQEARQAVAERRCFADAAC